MRYINEVIGTRIFFFNISLRKIHVNLYCNKYVTKFINSLKLVCENSYEQGALSNG